MTIKKWLAFTYIKVNRFIFRKKYLTIFGGPLKGYLWSTKYNYEYLTGEYETQESLDQFYSWLSSDSVFYDLGANVGYYSFMANKILTSGKIYSFEPLPQNIAEFRKHLELNQLKLRPNNITLMPYAVSDTEKEVIFSNCDISVEGNTYINSEMHTASTKDLVVQCYSVDGLMRKGYPAPNVLKIDVEGAEFDVLMGALNTLKQFKPKIFLATHDCHLPGVQKKCIDLLHSLGYATTKLPGDNKIMPGLDDYIAEYHS